MLHHQAPHTVLNTPPLNGVAGEDKSHLLVNLINTHACIVGKAVIFLNSLFFFSRQYISVPISISNLGMLDQQDYWKVSATCPVLSHCQAVKKYRYLKHLSEM